MLTDRKWAGRGCCCTSLNNATYASWFAHRKIRPML